MDIQATRGTPPTRVPRVMDCQATRDAPLILVPRAMGCNATRDIPLYPTGLLDDAGRVLGPGMPRFFCRLRHLMLLTVKSAVAEDEQAVVALWRACDLVASYNDPVFAHGDGPVRVGCRVNSIGP